MVPPASMPELVEQLRGGEAAAQTEAAGTLAAVALDSASSRAAIMHAGGATAAVDALRRMGPPPADSDVQAGEAAAVLAALATEAACASAVILFGALPGPVRALRTGVILGAAGDGLVCRRARALALLAGAQASCRRMSAAGSVLDEGVVPVLVDARRSGQPQQVRAAASALAGLAAPVDADWRFEVAAAPLARCLREAAPKTRALAAMALGTLAKGGLHGGAMKAAALAAGALPAAEDLRSSADPQVAWWASHLATLIRPRPA